MATIPGKNSPGASSFEVGVFHTAAAAERAIRSLRARGFLPRQIAIITGDRSADRRFREYRHWATGGMVWRRVLMVGALIGAGTGAAVAGVLSLFSGWELLTTGLVCLAAGAIIGGLTSLMLTRGQQLEPADYYEQAVTPGEVLVAVEQTTEDQGQLADAAEVFRQAGARPIELPRG